MEIRSTIGSFDRIHSIWGFGSFFRKGKFEDIDILVVVTSSREQLLSDSQGIRTELFTIERRIGRPIDALILTTTEFESRPLRDMDELVRIQ